MNENFQRLAGEQGRIGEDLAIIRLEDAGFQITGMRVSMPGVEVDIIALNKHMISFYFSVKASWRGDRQGLKRTDTLKKAIAEAYLIHQNGFGPVVIITSHKPENGRGLEMVRLVPIDTLFDIVVLHNDLYRLRWMANSDNKNLEDDMLKREKIRLGMI